MTAEMLMDPGSIRILEELLIKPNLLCRHLYQA
jgi:hypothetical protein